MPPLAHTLFALAAAIVIIALAVRGARVEAFEICKQGQALAPPAAQALAPTNTPPPHTLDQAWEVNPYLILDGMDESVQGKAKIALLARLHRGSKVLFVDDAARWQTVVSSAASPGQLSTPMTKLTDGTFFRDFPSLVSGEWGVAPTLGSGSTLLTWDQSSPRSLEALNFLNSTTTYDCYVFDWDKTLSTKTWKVSGTITNLEDFDKTVFNGDLLRFILANTNGGKKWSVCSQNTFDYNNDPPNRYAWKHALGCLHAALTDKRDEHNRGSGNQKLYENSDVFANLEHVILKNLRAGRSSGAAPARPAVTC
jgi:hypothetical protein